MRLKSELYKKEQDDIIDKIISILDLENRNTYTLYELDHNEDIQEQINKQFTTFIASSAGGLISLILIFHQKY